MAVAFARHGRDRADANPLRDTAPRIETPRPAPVRNDDDYTVSLSGNRVPPHRRKAFVPPPVQVAPAPRRSPAGAGSLASRPMPHRDARRAG